MQGDFVPLPFITPGSFFKTDAGVQALLRPGHQRQVSHLDQLLHRPSSLHWELLLPVVSGADNIFDHLCSLSNCFAGGFNAVMAMPWVREQAEGENEVYARLIICCVYVIAVYITLCAKDSNKLNLFLGFFMLFMVCLFGIVVYQISIKGNISWDT